jgi:hypothetical protein
MTGDDRSDGPADGGPERDSGIAARDGSGSASDRGSDGASDGASDSASHGASHGASRGASEDAGRPAGADQRARARARARRAPDWDERPTRDVDPEDAYRGAGRDDDLARLMTDLPPHHVDRT